MLGPWPFACKKKGFKKKKKHYWHQRGKWSDAISEPNTVYLSLLGLLVASLSSIGQRHHLRCKLHSLRLLLCLHEGLRLTCPEANHWILHSHGEEIPHSMKAQCKATASKTLLRMPASFSHTAHHLSTYSIAQRWWG